jgi:hypothetical protein
LAEIGEILGYVVSSRNFTADRLPSVAQSAGQSRPDDPRSTRDIHRPGPS